jgi:DeoR family deoxyribose operon repressor
MQARKRARLTQIVDSLQGPRSASVHELAEALKVSDMTVRRDLQLLARDNLVRLVRAGAVLTPPADSPRRRYSLTEAGATRVEQKLRIGRAAAALIGRDDVVIIDSGSTTECLARSLPEELPITVICFALNILVEAHRGARFRLVLAGGALHDNTLMFECAEGVELVRRHRATKAFISASGVSERLGVTCANDYEVETKKAALASSLTRILLADSSKFGLIRSAYFAELREFEVVITDSELDPEVAESIRALGIELVLA